MVDERKPSLTGVASATSAASAGSGSATAGGTTQEPQDVSKRDQIVSVVPEDSVHITPPRHFAIYYFWVVCCSLLTLLMVPLSFAVLAHMHHGRNTTSAPPHFTADEVPGGPDECSIPPESRYLGKSISHSGEVFCVYNARSRNRRSLGVHYYPLMVPVAFCNHFLYHSVSINQYIPELQSRDEQHDFGCLGLKTIRDLSRNYLHLKTHLVVGRGNSPVESAPFDTLFVNRDALRIFVKSVSEWLGSYGFDGVFIRWETPLDSSLPTTLFSSLRAGLPSHKMLGAILPASIPFLQNYDLPQLLTLVNWTIALMHDLFPKIGYDLTSCPSPLRGPNDTIENVVRQYASTIGNTNQTAFCFSVSCAGSKYEVNVSSGVGPASPTGLNSTAVEHPISYDRVCKREAQAQNDTSGQCMYLDDRKSRIFFHSVWSMAEVVKGISAMLRKERIVLDAADICVAVWDIDLDDVWGNCSLHFLDRYPLLEGVVRAMTP